MCLLRGTNWGFILQKTGFFIVTAVEIKYEYAFQSKNPIPGLTISIDWPWVLISEQQPSSSPYITNRLNINKRFRATTQFQPLNYRQITTSTYFRARTQFQSLHYQQTHHKYLFQSNNPVPALTLSTDWPRVLISEQQPSSSPYNYYYYYHWTANGLSTRWQR
jgi:hypothetical protein